jgi:hypothetical protein
MKKAQNGMAKMAKKDPKEAMKKGMNFDKKSFDSLPKLKTKKAKSGGEFGMLSVKAGIDKNPKPTAADRIAGAKGLAKSGKKVAKKMMKSGGTVSMQLGSYDRQIGKNYTGKATKAVGLTKAMNGKMMKGGGKCKNGC